MRYVALRLGLVGCLALVLAVPAGAQDYRARVQGVVVDSSQGALPGVTVTLTNDARAVAVTRVTDATGRYLFDFVDPGTYTIVSELAGFKKSEQKGVRVQQRGDVTIDFMLELGTLEETVTVVAESVSVQFNTGSSDITLERQLIDQAPISGRNPYNLANLDPTIIVSPATSENRRWTRSRRSRSPRPPWTPRTATAWAASSA